MDDIYRWLNHVTSLLLIDKKGIYNIFALLNNALMNLMCTSWIF